MSTLPVHRRDEHSEIWAAGGAESVMRKILRDSLHLDANGQAKTAHQIRKLDMRFQTVPLKYFLSKLDAAFEVEWEACMGDVLLDLFVKDREDRKDGRQRSAKDIRDSHALFKRIPMKLFTTRLKEARLANPVAPAWRKSLAKEHLQELIEAGFDRDEEGVELSTEEMMAFDERFKLYSDFANNLKRMRERIYKVQVKSDEHAKALQHHMIQSRYQSKMNAQRIDIHGHWIQYPKWQHSFAKQILLRDLAFLASQGVKIRNDEEPQSIKPKVLWLSRDVYQDFPLKVFREHIYQEMRTAKQINWNRKQKEDRLSKLR